ncbi:type II toxin-antitoxin system VapC family toxin [Arvimicrobium flavum]|uniref:type II toxin-antitoxin system VapC family toxin n=1 Tax=Arvimicrobium flavum TaxID=3393320 RepID=UPI00237A1A93|nr:type II toxin-antitoxin system VapC family toxin [Mesorhizobium shangrilense]
MRVTADTNVLLRAILADNLSQAAIAQQTLMAAEIVVVTTPTLCELAWVLHRTYRQGRDEIAKVIRGLLTTANVAMNIAAANAGLAILEAGGDFADGAIAFEGDQLGGDIFVTFDRNAHVLLERSGAKSHLLITGN